MLDEAWLLDASVALRPERFGALAYHFGNRKLVFLKTQELAELVELLAHHGTVREALAFAGVPEPAWPAYVAALTGLADSGIIRRAEGVAA